MRITYLVLAHRQPRQFARLAAALTVGGDRVLVHIDASSDQSEFEAALDDPALCGRANQVQFVRRREAIRWGDFRIVAAELELLRRALDEAPADYYVLLSGADYPIKPRAQLTAELASGAVYMDCWPMPHEARGMLMSRLEHFHLASKKRSRLVRLVNKRVLSRLPKRNVNKGLGGRRPYAGSQWWAMPHAVACQVLNFTVAQPKFVSFFRWSRIPDEMLFQTIVSALPEQAGNLRPSLTFVEWSRDRRNPRALASPATLQESDLAQLQASPHFFARKFDLDQTPELLSQIDATLLRDWPA